MHPASVVFHFWEVMDHVEKVMNVKVPPSRKACVHLQTLGSYPSRDIRITDFLAPLLVADGLTVAYLAGSNPKTSTLGPS